MQGRNAAAISFENTPKEAVERLDQGGAFSAGLYQKGQLLIENQLSYDGLSSLPLTNAQRGSGLSPADTNQTDWHARIGNY